MSRRGFFSLIAAALGARKLPDALPPIHHIPAEQRGLSVRYVRQYNRLDILYGVRVLSPQCSVRVLA